MFTEKWLQLLQTWEMFKKQMLSLMTFGTLPQLRSRSVTEKQKMQEKITNGAKGFVSADITIILVNNIFLNLRKHKARTAGADLLGLPHPCHPDLPGSRWAPLECHGGSGDTLRCFPLPSSMWCEQGLQPRDALEESSFFLDLVTSTDPAFGALRVEPERCWEPPKPGNLVCSRDISLMLFTEKEHAVFSGNIVNTNEHLWTNECKHAFSEKCRSSETCVCQRQCALTRYLCQFCFIICSKVLRVFLNNYNLKTLKCEFNGYMGLSSTDVRNTRNLPRTSGNFLLPKVSNF